MNRNVAIVGGGLAGIASAIRLADAGYRPLILETRRKLGGRATSFVDPRTGETLDNCQHVVMGCCTALLDLYERLGVLDRIVWSKSTYWAVPNRRPDRITPGWCPCPGHFTGAFLRMRLLTLGEKIAIGRAMWRLIRLGAAGRVAWRDRPFIDFLAECRQPAGAVEKFWEPIVVSACNMPCARVGASYAMHVFQDGFLGNRFASAVGLAAVPLVELYDPAEALLAQAGGGVRLGVSAKALAFDGTLVSGVVTDEGFVIGSSIISTVPPDRLDKLISSPLRAADARLKRLNEFTYSPILGVHLRFECEVLDVPHLVLPGRGTQWLFNKGVDDAGRQQVHAVISAADAWMELDEREIVKRVTADIHAVLPKSRGLQPVDARSVKEKRATFAALPALEAIRPRAASGPIGGRIGGGGGVRNLFLAGDWCDTGWPATMEGAVRSGYAAAEAIAKSPMSVPDLPTAGLAQFLGLSVSSAR